MTGLQKISTVVSCAAGIAESPPWRGFAACASAGTPAHPGVAAIIAYCVCYISFSWAPPLPRQNKGVPQSDLCLNPTLWMSLGPMGGALRALLLSS